MKTQKPGWKTKGFWLTLLTVLGGGVVAAGVVPEAGVYTRIMALATTALASLGYTLVRVNVKLEEGSKKKPWRTTEFWLSFAAVLIPAVMASGLIADGTLAAKIVGFIGAALVTLGYAKTSGVTTNIDAAGEPYAGR